MRNLSSSDFSSPVCLSLYSHCIPSVLPEQIREPARCNADEWTELDLVIFAFWVRLTCRVDRIPIHLEGATLRVRLDVHYTTYVSRDDMLRAVVARESGGVKQRPSHGDTDACGRGKSLHFCMHRSRELREACQSRPLETYEGLVRPQLSLFGREFVPSVDDDW